MTQQRQELQLAQSEKHNADNELRSLERELTQVISNGQAVCKEKEQNNTLLKQAITDLGASGRSGLQQMNKGSCQHHGFMSAGESEGGRVYRSIRRSPGVY